MHLLTKNWSENIKLKAYPKKLKIPFYTYALTVRITQKIQNI